MMPTRDDFVAGRVDEAVNQAVGDIFPGAHVAVTWFDAPTETWSLAVVLPALPEVTATEQASLQEIIDLAEKAVTDAKIKLLRAWGVDDYEAVTE